LHRLQHAVDEDPARLDDQAVGELGPARAGLGLALGARGVTHAQPGDPELLRSEGFDAALQLGRGVRLLLARLELVRDERTVLGPELRFPARLGRDRYVELVRAASRRGERAHELLAAHAQRLEVAIG